MARSGYVTCCPCHGDHPRKENPVISRVAIAAALAAMSGTALAQTTTQSVDSAYVQDSTRKITTGAFGQCVRTGYWNPSLAADPCDPTAHAGLQPAARAQQ